MKLGIIVGILIGIVLLAIAGVAIFVTRTNPSGQIASTETNTPIQSSISPNLIASPTIKSSNIPASSPLASPTPNSLATSSSSSAVNFVPSITGVSGSDLTTRTITAQLANTGTADAHNVQAKIEAYSQGTRIELNGQDYLIQSFSTIKAGAAMTIQYTVSVNIIDGLKILQNGVTFILTISSDEKTQTISYDYHP